MDWHEEEASLKAYIGILIITKLNHVQVIKIIDNVKKEEIAHSFIKLQKKGK